MTNLIEKQPDICSHNGFCGGCAYQGLPYNEQLRLKDGEVQKQLENSGVVFGEYIGMEGSPRIYRYRNKMEYTFGDMVKGGEMTLGMHRKKKYMSVVTVDGCQLVDEDFNTILRATLEFCVERGYTFYGKKTRVGFLRHLILRKGERTNELLVNIVTSSQGDFDEAGYVGRLSKLNLNNSIVGILNTINDRPADAVFCDKLRVLQGRDYYVESIMGLDFKIGAFSFFQTNIAAAERLYSEALSLITGLEGKTVFDLYCGTGTITQAIAKRAKKVVGIELVGGAVLSAKENAGINGCTNCEFIAGDVYEMMEGLSDKPDVIVLDPPRAGVSQKALKKIAGYGAEQIVYISCNPKTLADNLVSLQDMGYKTVKVKAYDNFPFTKHSECIGYMNR